MGHGVEWTDGEIGIDADSLYRLGKEQADAILAATAENEQAELKTFNVKHFPMMKGLKPPYRK
jgi:predicted nucleic acid-binding protein